MSKGKKMGRVGRPNKYGHILTALKKNVAYTPSLIAHFAKDHKLAPFDQELSPEDTKLHMVRIRIAMGRMSKLHSFPREGDEVVRLPGQGATPGWFGRRWASLLANN